MQHTQVDVRAAFCPTPQLPPPSARARFVYDASSSTRDSPSRSSRLHLGIGSRDMRYAKGKRDMRKVSRNVVPEAPPSRPKRGSWQTCGSGKGTKSGVLHSGVAVRDVCPTDGKVCAPPRLLGPPTDLEASPGCRLSVWMMLAVDCIYCESKNRNACESSRHTDPDRAGYRCDRRTVRCSLRVPVFQCSSSFSIRAVKHSTHASQPVWSGGHKP
eukprot:scaffold11434_cov127-Isochrysis_galbana.AAC.4